MTNHENQPEREPASDRAAPVSVLVVDDDQVDIMLIQRAFARHPTPHQLVNACDGVEALSILRGNHPLKSVSRPLLILLDLNMPRMNGIEFLTELRKDPQLMDIPVFVLSTSDDDRDVRAAYRHQVAGYVLKSSAGDQYIHLLKLLEDYWKIVQLPPGTDL